MKRRAYCKLHNTFSHATNDCNVFRRQIQSAINEGQLVISAIQVDQNLFPMHTHVLELKNPKVLIRPSQAESTKGKNVIIGEERKVLQNKTPRAATKTSTLGGKRKEKKTGSNLTGQTGTSSGLTGFQTGLTGASSNSENSSTVGTRTRPSFKELLAKYDKEGAVQKQKERPDKVKGSKSTSTSSEQSDSRLRQDNYVVTSNSKSIAPWFWSYPCYYTPLDYSRMYIQLYYIQYPSMYPNCIPQRPISNNLVEKTLIAARRVRRT